MTTKRPFDSAKIISDQGQRILTLVAEIERLTADKEGLTLALRAAEAKIESMETVYQRMLGWQDCAREVMRRHGNPQAVAVSDFSQLLKGPLS